MMAWKSEADISSTAPNNGFKGIGELNDPGDNLRVVGDRCSTRRVVQSRCKTEEVEPGRFVRKCEKEEKLFRECVGRPVELVESRTEQTEDDVTDQVKSHGITYDSGIEPFTFPVLRGDIEAIEGSLRGGFSHFLEAAEAMANEIFNSFPIPPTDGRKSSLRGRWGNAERENEKDASSAQKNESSHCEFVGELRDV